MFSLFKDEIFKQYLVRSVIVFWITIVVGIMIGILLPHNMTTVITNYAVNESISGRMMNIVGADPLHSTITVFINNSIIAFLFAVMIPFIYRNKKLVDETSMKLAINVLIIAFAAQIFMVGIIIGFYIPIIHNNLIVLATLVPHGIFEIPAIITSVTIGLWYIKSQHGKTSYIELCKIFAIYVIPILLIAAIIEVNITPLIVKMIMT